MKKSCPIFWAVVREDITKFFARNCGDKKIARREKSGLLCQGALRAGAAQDLPRLQRGSRMPTLPDVSHLAIIFAAASSPHFRRSFA
jgi:hypothetical protein